VITTFAGDTAEDFRLWAQEIRETRMAAAFRQPRITLCDGNWVTRGDVYDPTGSLVLPLNDVGNISLTLPIDYDDRRGTWAAWWALEEERRGTRNIHLLLDKSGGRIGGRMESATLKSGGDSGDVVIVEFSTDVDELRHVHMQSNPFLPISLISQPKEMFLFAPADWGLKATLAMQLMRLQATNFNMSLDILNPANWSGGLWADSQIVVVPGSLAGSASPTTFITGNIKQDWLSIAQPILEDAELMLDCWRWRDGDSEPWPGAGTSWRQGQLFVDIVDKSGYRSGTSLFGNLATGMARTIAGVTTDYVEDSYDLITGDPEPTGAGYDVAGMLGTKASHPHVVYVDSKYHRLPEFEFRRTPGGACRITAGGRSMPGVNALLEAVITYAGDVLGDNLGVVLGVGLGVNINVGSLGGVLTAFLMPILEDSILAYMSVPLPLRAAQQGWGHKLETACTGVTQAYTPSGLMDLRKRRRETDPDTAFSFNVVDASPYLIGDRGQGHWWLGDRVGATVRYLGARVFVCRNRELSMEFGPGADAVLKPKFGNLRTLQDPLERLIGEVSKAAGALQTIGLL
jgi:hypothetical protein